MKIWFIIGSIIFAAFLWIIAHERKSAKNEIKLDEAKQEIEIQHVIIKDQKDIFQRKIINKSVSSDDNLQWLRANICQDCED